MGLAKKAGMESEDALAVALEAAAIRVCPFHAEVQINQGNPAAVKRAYAMGTNYWKHNDLLSTREEFMDMIKDAIDMSAEECPACAKIRDE